MEVVGGKRVPPAGPCRGRCVFGRDKSLPYEPRPPRRPIFVTGAKAMCRAGERSAGWPRAHKLYVGEGHAPPGGLAEAGEFAGGPWPSPTNQDCRAGHVLRRAQRPCVGRAFTPAGPMNFPKISASPFLKFAKVRRAKSPALRGKANALRNGNVRRNYM